MLNVVATHLSNYLNAPSDCYIMITSFNPAVEEKEVAKKVELQSELKNLVDEVDTETLMKIKEMMKMK